MILEVFFQSEWFYMMNTRSLGYFGDLLYILELHTYFFFFFFNSHFPSIFILQDTEKARKACVILDPVKQENKKCIWHFFFSFKLLTTQMF